ncbi:MAG: nitroreductase family protein [Chloroflexota bacterium]|nr:nitroreductase family protein [Chloroflexota bacterium]
MPDTSTALDVVRPLVRVRQIREFTSEPVSPAELEAISEVGRWSGSSRNEQPWRFIVIRDDTTLRKIAELGLPPTRSLKTATAAVAIVVPSDPKRAVSHAYDEGRAAERMLTAASMLGLGAAIAWVIPAVRETVGELLGLPDGWMVRTIVAIGHPTAAAKAPKAAPGTARRPRGEAVFEERWPSGA